MGLITSTLYYYCVTSWGDIVALATLTWYFRSTLLEEPGSEQISGVRGPALNVEYAHPAHIYEFVLTSMLDEHGFDCTVCLRPSDLAL